MPPKSFPSLPPGWTTTIETHDSVDKEVKLSGYFHASKEFLQGEGQGRLLFVLHGMGEHGGRYSHFPHYLQKEVDAIFCIDHRGHGRSTGPRGHAKDFDLLVDDVAMIARLLDARLKAAFPESNQLHLFGHSMGGQVALRTLLHHPELPFCSATVSSPLMAIAAKVPAFKAKLAQLLANVWGSLPIPTGVDPAVVSHDPEVVAAYKKDPLVHDKMSPAFFTSLLKVMENTRASERGIQPPILATIPLQDKLAKSEVTLAFFEKLKHSRKNVVTFPDFYHESFNEIGKERAFKELADWIRENSDNPVS